MQLMKPAMMTIADQRDLILRVREGNSDAITAFHELLQKAATPATKRFQDQDLVNEIFVNFLESEWQQLNKWRGEGPLENWLAVIARRTAVGKLKYSRCQPPLNMYLSVLLAVLNRGG